MEQSNKPNARRKFLGTLAASAGIGIASLALPNNMAAAPLDLTTEPGPGDADKWFDKVKGKHRIVFDCTQPHEIFPFAWPKVFLLTNQGTGSAISDCTAVVILRHTAIAYAFDSRIWEKYHFGELFGAPDPKTKAPATRNPFWQPAAGDFKLPGIGEVQIGIDQLQADGVMFCVCEMAISVFTGAAGMQMKMDAADVRKEWMAGLLPGIQPVPSGVWAVGRAQEHGCAYCFAG